MSLARPGEGQVEPERVVREIEARRGLRSKTYELESGEWKTVITPRALHYKDDFDDPAEGWKDIDLTVPDDLHVAKAPYELDIFADRIGYRYRSKRGGEVEVELAEVGDGAVDTSRFSVRREANVIWWDDVGDGLHLKMVLRPLSVEVFKMLEGAEAPRRLLWKVSEAAQGRVNFRRRIAGLDNAGDRLEIETRVLNERLLEGRRHFDFEERWTGRVSEIVDPRTRRKDWKDAPAYPVLIDATTTEDIKANLDDGYEYDAGSSWTALGSGDWRGDYTFWRPSVGLYASTFQPKYWEKHAGLRFQDVGVPDTATISAATLVVHPQGDFGHDVAIYGEDVDSAAAWASTTHVPSNITKTTAQVTLTSPGSSTPYSIDVQGIVSEIMGRAGWASGNHMAFGLLNADHPTGGFTSDVWVLDNYTDPDPAQLEITYSLPDPVEVNMGVGSLSADGPQFGLQPGAVEIGMDVGVLSADGPQFSLEPGPVTVEMAAAVLSADGLHFSVDEDLSLGGPAFAIEARGAFVIDRDNVFIVEERANKFVVDRG